MTSTRKSGVVILALTYVIPIIPFIILTILLISCAVFGTRLTPISPFVTFIVIFIPTVISTFMVLKPDKFDIVFKKFIDWFKHL